MKDLIINADDFGLKSSVNKAIVESFLNGNITSTTIMANMPGFEEAIELAYENRIDDKLGIHLNLTDGNPLTVELLNLKLFRNAYKTDLRKYKKELFFLSLNDKRMIFKEFSSQIEKVKRCGIKITHIDTHHHIDEVWPITRIIISLLKQYGIPSMRIINNLNRSSEMHKFFYRRIVNNYIKIKKANLSDLFGNQVEVISMFKDNHTCFNGKKLEIMVHPDYNNSGVIVDKLQSKELPFEFPKGLKRT